MSSAPIAPSAPSADQLHLFSLFVEWEGERIELRPCHQNPQRYAVARDGRVFELGAGGPARERARSLAEGYPAVWLRLPDGVARRCRVHRLVCWAFHGPPPAPSWMVRHLDGDRLNSHADNLAWGSHRDNVADAARHDQERRYYKLRPSSVQMLRLDWLLGTPLPELAERYNCSVDTARAALCGSCWGWVQNPAPIMDTSAPPELTPSQRESYQRLRARLELERARSGGGAS